MASSFGRICVTIFDLLKYIVTKLVGIDQAYIFCSQLMVSEN